MPQRLEMPPNFQAPNQKNATITQKYARSNAIAAPKSDRSRQRRRGKQFYRLT
jgi:hypothetical protein